MGVGHFEGGWTDNRRAGLGVFRCANGDRYEGHWLDDQKEGPGRFFYLSTGKVYEGEWVNGAPKCGSFRDSTPEELDAEEAAPEARRASAGDSVKDFLSSARLLKRLLSLSVFPPERLAAAPLRWRRRRNAQAAEVFRLPALCLMQPEVVVSKRVAEIRQLRAHSAAERRPDAEMVVRSFSDDELAVLRHVFTIQDKQNSGFVQATSVGFMLERCRMPVEDLVIERLLAEIEADEDTRVSFAEFVDMAALLLSA